MAKSNQEKEELKLKYVRFYYEVDEVDGSRNYRFCDPSFIIVIFLSMSFVKCISYK